MAKILILTESKSMRNSLAERLEYEGYLTRGAESEDEALKMCQREQFDTILCDEGFDISNCGTPFMVLSESPTVESAVRALRRGACDYFSRPYDMNRIMGALKRSVEQESEPSISRPVRRQRHPKDSGVEPIVGSSEGILRVRNLIDRVAPTDARVLVTGENGTGKELVARWLHAKSHRASAPFVEVNCAAIPSELIESELFGHEKGAFTSAVKQRKGKFEQADGGTLFMDEIGDMSLSAQAKVLRALQESRISRVGSDRDVAVDVRVVAATNKNLKEEILKGNFREDLYHRLSVIVIDVPSLRERREDISLLADYFLEKICREQQLPRRTFTDEAKHQLEQMPWSGNIRELHNVVERLVILAEGNITKPDVVSWGGYTA